MSPSRARPASCRPEDEDTVDRLVRRPDLVHRVFGDEERSIRRGGDLAGILHRRDSGDEPDREPLRHLRQRSDGRSGEGKPDDQCRRRGQGPPRADQKMRIRSSGFLAGPTWSFGSSATKSDPSGAVATWQGYCTAGTAATSRIVNPSGTFGSAATAAPARASQTINVAVAGKARLVQTRR